MATGRMISEAYIIAERRIRSLMEILCSSLVFWYCLRSSAITSSCSMLKEVNITKYPSHHG